ncbi:MAG: flagellar protein FlbD [Candidatus Omnitrophota bacterium]|nr:MAG: flagellar protein FlbD [Candidatus Omnitrophota bacterium]
MIELTKLNGTVYVLNADLIETLESTPDTVISLVTGRKYIVRESLDEVRKKCISYKREIYTGRE